MKPDIYLHVHTECNNFVSPFLRAVQFVCTRQPVNDRYEFFKNWKKFFIFGIFGCATKIKMSISEICPIRSVSASMVTYKLYVYIYIYIYIYIILIPYYVCYSEGV